MNYEMVPQGDDLIPVYKLTGAERIALLHKALDWLDANPTNVTYGTMATDAEGNDCDPDDPKADCFCVLGRMVIEGGLVAAQVRDFHNEERDTDFYKMFDAFFEPLHASASTIYTIADRSHSHEPVATIPSLAANRLHLRYLFPLEKSQ